MFIEEDEEIIELFGDERIVERSHSVRHYNHPTEYLNERAWVDNLRQEQKLYDQIKAKRKRASGLIDEAENVIKDALNNYRRQKGL